MEIGSAQVSSEQLIDIVKSSLASDLKVAACQQLIKILFHIPMFKSRWSKIYIH